VEAIVPILQKFSDWAAEHPEVFTILAVAIGAIAVSVLAINAAMALNPITAIAIGIGLVAAAAVIAYKKFETFRTIVDNVFGAIRWWVSNVILPVFQGLLGAAVAVFKGIAAAWNNTVGRLSFTLPSWIPGNLGGKSFSMPKIGEGGSGSGGGSAGDFRAFEEAQKGLAIVPSDVVAPSVAMAPSKVSGTTAPTVFDNTSGNAGGFEQAGIGGIGPFSNITINMDAGLVSSPATVGQDIIDAILAAQRDSGIVFAPAVTF
jgi:hypothetical protein